MMVSPLQFGLVFMTFMYLLYITAYFDPEGTLSSLFADNNNEDLSFKATPGELFLVTALGAYMMFYGCICLSTAFFANRNGQRCVLYSILVKAVFFVRFYMSVAPMWERLPASQILLGIQIWGLVLVVLAGCCILDLVAANKTKTE